jgi:hypothetical protein
LISLFKIRAVFKTALILSVFISSSLFAGFLFDSDLSINQKTQSKMKEMGDELFSKTGISTAIVAKKSLNKSQFLELKSSYLKELKAPYVLWMFAKTYTDEDSNRTGKLNILLSSDDLVGKFDESSMFSPFGGSFTKLIVIQKSKSDPTGAAFLNGYADLTDMLASSHGVKLDSSIGDETKITMDITRVIFYAIFLFFFLWYAKNKLFKKGN